MPSGAARAAELSSALQTLHRALIRAEIGDDPELANPYTRLFALIGDPRFAWMGPLAKLIVRIDEAATKRETTAAEGDGTETLADWRREAAALIGVGDGPADSEFRLRHLIALQKEPEVGLATGRLRKVLAVLDEASPDPG